MRFLTFAILPLAAMLAACDGDTGCPSDSYCPEQRMVYTLADGTKYVQDGTEWYQLFTFDGGTKDWLSTSGPTDEQLAKVQTFQEEEVWIDGSSGLPHSKEYVDREVAKAEAEAAAYDDSYSEDETLEVVVPGLDDDY